MFTYSPIHYSEEEEEKEEEDIHTSERRVYGLSPRTRIFDVSFFGKSITTTVTYERREIRRWIYSNFYYNRRNRYNLVVGLGVQWFLANEKITFVGIWTYSDNKKLSLSKHRLFVSRLINLSKFRLGNESSRGSMENLIWDYLGFKGVRKDEMLVEVTGMLRISVNCNAKNLSVDQVQYATVDVYASFEIGKKIGAWKFKT
ncbi:hypothetical protein MKW92_041632 [Papaver armeniacum]|nr:hypothetical protein MKW92_041632 [Papaver armeniacum]